MLLNQYADNEQEEARKLPATSTSGPQGDGKDLCSVRMLAAYLDVGGRLQMEGDKLDVQAQLKGLRLETVIDIDSGAPAAKGDKQKGKSLARLRPLIQHYGSSVLILVLC